MVDFEHCCFTAAVVIGHFAVFYLFFQQIPSERFANSKRRTSFLNLGFE